VQHFACHAGDLIACLPNARRERRGS
jgi:hypothetical protein